jgi:mannose-1-phosphate guanylyltransferase
MPFHSPVTKNWNQLTAAYPVLHFYEKPERNEAKKFLESGNFAWNAGIFVWRAKTIFDLLQRFEPKIGEQLGKIADAVGTDAEQVVTEQCFSAMDTISIDCAVMERAEKIVMIEAAFDWNDVGTWSALDRLYANQHDENGNLAVGTELVAVDSTNCIVRGNDPNHLIALLGMDDIIVVQTPDATLVARKNQEESVRKIIDELKKRNQTKWM